MSFPSSYFEARDRFRELTSGEPWKCDAFAIQSRGPNGEELTIDLAIREVEACHRYLVVTSGLHGIEGFVGSAIQCKTLAQWQADALPSDVNLIFVHGLNPYGFAWQRRFDENNVDPNRNFFLDGNTGQGCADVYRSLNRFLNPESAASGIDFFLPRACLAILRYGYRPVARAVARGQYEFPKGLFFGGHGPSEAQQIIQSNLSKWILNGKDPAQATILHVDIHSGLGSRGNTQLLLEQTLPPDEMSWLEKHFGTKSISRHDHNELLYRADGSFGQWCVANLPQSSYTFACAEIGTYPSISVLSGLRTENRVTHWDPANTVMLERSRDRLKELFCPRDPRWRTRVQNDGVAILDNSVNALRDKTQSV